MYVRWNFECLRRVFLAKQRMHQNYLLNRRLNMLVPESKESVHARELRAAVRCLPKEWRCNQERVIRKVKEHLKLSNAIRK